MKKILVFLVIFSVPTLAQAQVSYLWFEPQVAVEKNDAGQIATGEYFDTISFGYQRSPWFGLFAQTAHGNLWGETVFGPSFALTSELSVGIGMGVEHHAPNSIRLRLNVYYDHENTGSFVYAQFDTDKESRWTWVDSALMFGNVGIGVLLQMPGGGTGPKFELRVGDHLGFWIAPVYEWEENVPRTLVGGRVMWSR